MASWKIRVEAVDRRPTGERNKKLTTVVRPHLEVDGDLLDAARQLVAVLEDMDPGTRRELVLAHFEGPDPQQLLERSDPAPAGETRGDEPGTSDTEGTE